MSAAAVFDLHRGHTPIVVSVPHDGREIPERIAARMSDDALSLPDTDWHVARLYDFCRDLGATLLVARFSRYVVDLNRPPSDEALYPGQVSTGLCPERTFAGARIYRDGDIVSAAEREERTAHYWRPYHEALGALLDANLRRHGVALLWDAHSIASRVPALFDGELPALNIGTNGGTSCGPRVRAALADALERVPFSATIDGRFRGGYITRHYGRPERGIHAVQMELAQRCYLRESVAEYDEALAARLLPVLAAMLQSCLAAAVS
jgi:N-formylglutamate amidohydrolase